MRLRRVLAVDFRTSIDTHLRFLRTTEPQFQRSLKKDDVICLLSRRGNQLAFVWDLDLLGIQRGERIEVTRCVRLRLSRGAWNPLMLANYAEHVGLTLTGLARFEDHMKRMTKRSRTAA